MAALAIGCVLAGGAAPDGRAAATAALEASGAAWSRGDLDGFMQIYEASPETSYASGNRTVRGYDAIRAMYASRFGGGAGMGALSFAVLDYRPLGADHALLTGRFRLSHGAQSDADPQGIFTLVFHRGAAGWRVISDHTSS
jgi:hypothetical protein